jgi:hypothetical protein
LPASYHSRVASIRQKEVRRSFARRLALKRLWPNAAPSWPKGREAGGGAMKRDSLSTLDLRERPENKITIIRRVHHHQIDGPLELRPGERPFAPGPRHSAYIVMVEREEPIARKGWRGGPGLGRSGPPRASLSGGKGAAPRVQFDRPQKTPSRELIQPGPIKHLSSNSQAVADGSAP